MMITHYNMYCYCVPSAKSDGSTAEGEAVAERNLKLSSSLLLLLSGCGAISRVTDTLFRERRRAGRGDAGTSGCRVHGCILRYEKVY